jgi:hypothetical protein
MGARARSASKGEIHGANNHKDRRIKLTISPTE